VQLQERLLLLLRRLLAHDRLRLYVGLGLMF
jgi:hypothetical protein